MSSLVAFTCAAKVMIFDDATEKSPRRPALPEDVEALGELCVVSEVISIFGCGVQKAGTTSLYAYLCQHPALSSPSQKELHFFDDEANDWASPDYNPLQSFFPYDDGRRLRFEVTPIYIFWPPAIERLHAYNPTAKLIMLFRDPFERALSQWCMEYERGDETLSFAEAIREGRRRMEGLPPLARERRIFTYVERGLYGEQVRRALTHFPREQMLFLRSEDLRDNHVATLARISTFAGLPPFPDLGAKREHPRPAVSRLLSTPTDDDHALIADFVRDDLRDFAMLTGLNISNWPTMQEPI
jgi:hypothetical protein